MALQVWLPLNGNLNNQGVDNISFTTNTGATISTAGKIGKCYSFDGNDDWIQGTFDKSKYSTKPMSLSCWFKCDKVKTGGVIVDLAADLCLGYSYSNSGIKFTAWRCYQNSSNNRVGSSCVTTTTYNADVWHHIVDTFDGGIEKIYVDGILAQTFDHTSLYTYNWTPLLTNAYNKISIGKSAGDSNWIGGLVNDVRIYDEILTPSQVKKLSQGLILHYPLNNNGWGNENIIAGTKSTEQTYTYPSSNYQDKFATVTTVIPTKDKYTLSFYAKSTVAGDKIRAHYYSPNTTTTCVSSQGITKTASDGHIDFTLTTDWKLYWVTYSQTETTAVKHVIIPRMGAQGNTIGVCSGTGTVSIKCVKLEAGDKVTSWCPNIADVSASQIGYNPSIEYDCSGYNYNGTKIETFSWTGDTPKYNVSQYFDDYTRYITCLIDNNWIPSAVTMSCWIKGSNKSARGGYHIPLNMHLTNFEISITSSSGKARMGYVVDGTRYVSDIGPDILDNQWHMLTSTFNGSTICRYIDGVLINSENKTGPLTVAGTLGVGNFPGGTTYGNTQLYESDVRIYVTALSAEDIQELYAAGHA